MAQKGERSGAKGFAAYMRARGITRTMGRCGACGSMHPIDSWKSHYKHSCSLRVGGSAAYRRLESRKAAR